MGWLVAAQALEHGVADATLPRPFGKRYLCDQFGLHPVMLPVDAFGVGKRAAGCLELLQLRVQRGQLLLAEATAHIARVAQAAIRVMYPQQQRPEAGAGALRFGVSADDELLPVAAFELDPVTASA